VVEIGSEAARHVRELLDHYEAKGRSEACINLATALAQAIERIELAPEKGIAAPRPYPGLSEKGRRWIKEGRYWFRYSLTAPPVIIAVFYDQANLPRRVR
jgi:plasmid stabilization system protein ParE